MGHCCEKEEQDTNEEKVNQLYNKSLTVQEISQKPIPKLNIESNSLYQSRSRTVSRNESMIQSSTQDCCYQSRGPSRMLSNPSQFSVNESMYENDIDEKEMLIMTNYRPTSECYYKNYSNQQIIPSNFQDYQTVQE